VVIQLDADVASLLGMTTSGFISTSLRKFYARLSRCQSALNADEEATR
jgi:hypothetical protein